MLKIRKLRLQKKIKKMFGHINPKDPPEHCPIRDVMALASDKWSILIVLYLGYYPVLRFNEIKKKVYGISSKVLSERLKMLEADGYLSRELYPEVPIRVEYALTAFWPFLPAEIIGELTEWAQTYSEQVIANRSKYMSDRA